MTQIRRYRTTSGEIFFGQMVGNAADRTALRWTAAPWLDDTAVVTDRTDKSVTWLLPVEPPAIYCIGLNYAAHAAESGAPIPKFPVVFMKPPSALIATEQPIVLPSCSDRVDYECELAVVIGRRVKNITEDDALSAVAGYAVANDVSARDWQKDFGGGQWIRGKSFDTFCPLGPAVTLASAIPDPQQLQLTTIIDDEERQNGTTADMIFSVAQLIAFLSTSTTLEPGTLILTGTPPGVAMGMPEPRWLADGQAVTCRISGLAELHNPVRAE